MERRNWERLAAVAGIVVVVLIVGAVTSTGSPPKPSDTNDAVKAFMLDKRNALVLQGWLFALGGTLLLWWTAAVRGVLRRAEGADGHFANAFYGALVGASVMLGVAAAIQVGLVYKALPDLDAGVVRAGFDMVALLPLFFGFLLALGALAFAVVTLNDAAFPAWVAWVAVLSAVANLAVTVTVFAKNGAFSAEGAFGFVGFGLTMLWLLVASIAMLRTGDAATAR